MAKPRRRKATKTTAKLKGKRPAKRSPSRRGTAKPSDDDVFIPRRSSDSRTSARATLEQPAGDEPVFVARAGAPVEVQSDWVDDDASNAGGVSDSEFWESLTPRAFTPNGWTHAQLREHGLIVRERGGVETVVCRYGCHGSTSNVPGVSAHAYNCLYWQNEGKHRTPFD